MDAFVSSKRSHRSDRVAALLCLIVAAGVFLRLYGQAHTVYQNPDDAVLAYFIVNGAKLPVFDTDPATNAIARLLSWDYGWPAFAPYFAYVRLLDVVHIPINELTLAIPIAVFGALIGLLLYLLALQFDCPDVGLLTAALLAVMPLWVTYGRTIGGFHHIPASILFMLAILCIVRYLKRPADGHAALWAGITTGLYICSDLQFPFGVLILLLLVALWPRERSGGWQAALMPLWNVRVLLPPVILFLPYVAAWLYARHIGYSPQTFLGTMFGEHSPDYGFHLIPLLNDLAMNMGIPAVIALIGIPFVLRAHWGDSRYVWLTAWTLVAAIPFLFLATRKVTMVWTYQALLLLSLVLLISMALLRIRHVTLRGLAIAVVIAGALATTFGGVFQVSAFKPFWPNRALPYGAVVPNNGMKAAGYWVRNNVPADARVFVTHDPAIAYWYMGREVTTGGYVCADRRGVAEAMGDELDVVVDAQRKAGFLPAEKLPYGMKGQIVVRNGGKPVLSIFTRKPIREELDTEQVDTLYNRQFNSLDTLWPGIGPYVPEKPLMLD